jgi:hypothetical protein
VSAAAVFLTHQDRGDRQRRVDKRNLDMAIPLAAPSDKRQGGQDPFSVCEVLARGAGWLWCAVHGPATLPTLRMPTK